MADTIPSPSESFFVSPSACQMAGWRREHMDVNKEAMSQYLNDVILERQELAKLLERRFAQKRKFRDLKVSERINSEIEYLVKEIQKRDEIINYWKNQLREFVGGE